MFLSHETPTRFKVLSLDAKGNTRHGLKNHTYTTAPFFPTIPENNTTATATSDGFEIVNDAQSSHERWPSVIQEKQSKKEKKEEEGNTCYGSANAPVMQATERFVPQQSDSVERMFDTTTTNNEGMQYAKERREENSNKSKETVLDSSRRIEVSRLLELPEELLSYLLLRFLGGAFLQDLCRISQTCRTLHRLAKPFLKTLRIRIVCCLERFLLFTVADVI